MRQQVTEPTKNHFEEIQFYGLLPSWFACVINHIDLLVMPVFLPLQARWYTGVLTQPVRVIIMSDNLFNSGRTVDSVAYDLALALASKDPSINTPDALLEKVESLLPECVAIVSLRKPKYAHGIDIGTTY